MATKRPVAYGFSFEDLESLSTFLTRPWRESPNEPEVLFAVVGARASYSVALSILRVAVQAWRGKNPLFTAYANQQARFVVNAEVASDLSAVIVEIRKTTRSRGTRTVATVRLHGVLMDQIVAVADALGEEAREYRFPSEPHGQKWTWPQLVANYNSGWSRERYASGETRMVAHSPRTIIDKILKAENLGGIGVRRNVALALLGVGLIAVAVRGGRL